MTTRVKVLLILVLGLILHLIMVIFAAITLSPNRTYDWSTAMVIPFGRLNYDQVTSVAAIEMLIVWVLFMVFAVFLFRQPAD